MDDRRSLYTRLKNLEKRLEVLEEFVLPRIEEEKRKKEEEKREKEKRIRKGFMQPLLDILWMKRILQKYYGCRLVGQRDYVTPEGKTWGISVPWGLRQLSDRAESVGFKSYKELFDKERVEKKLRVWNELFNEEEIEKILDELEKAPMKDLEKIYDMKEYERKIEVFKNRRE